MKTLGLLLQPSSPRQRSIAPSSTRAICPTEANSLDDSARGVTVARASSTVASEAIEHRRSGRTVAET